MTTQNPEKTRRFMRSGAVAELLDVSEQTVYAMAAEGRLPAFKVGRQWRFPAEEIERFIADGLARTA